jgi:hypothetical protein
MALVKTDVLEERRASIIRMARIGLLGTTLAITSNQRMLQRFFFNLQDYLARRKMRAQGIQSSQRLAVNL